MSEELVPPSLFEGLRTVSGLQYGRISARESEPVKPVAESDVEATLPFISPQVAAMIQLQLLTGMRPAEVVLMTPDQLIKEGEVWLYEPIKHINRWRGHQRVIPMEPKCQLLIQPFVNRDANAIRFSPEEA